MEKQMHEKREVKRAKRSRRWPWVLGGILILIILVVLLTPVFLSSGGFTRWVESTINQNTGGEANIGNLSVGWLRGVRGDFQFRGENGWAQVDIDRITTQPSYASLLGGTLALERTVIEQPRVAIDLRDRPAPAEDRAPTNLDNLSRLNDVIVRDGRVQITDTAGQTVQVADLNSMMSVRAPGRTSSFDMSMTVVQAQQPGRIQASGQVTPSEETGWSLRGTSGQFVVEVNDLSASPWPRFSHWPASDRGPGRSRQTSRRTFRMVNSKISTQPSRARISP
jgi:hypothetical protein